MPELDFILKSIQMPIQLAMLAILIWLYWRATGQLQDVWKQYLEGMQTANERLVNIIAGNTTALTMVNNGIIAMKEELLKHEEREERILTEIADRIAGHRGK
jgi:hypothetical protein